MTLTGWRPPRGPPPRRIVKRPVALPQGHYPTPLADSAKPSGSGPNSKSIRARNRPMFPPLPTQFRTSTSLDVGRLPSPLIRTANSLL